MKRYLLPAFALLACLPAFALDFTEPALSPDGRSLVFALSDGAQQDIYVSGADGSGMRKIVGLKGRNTHPRWSPDGSMILFNCFPYTAEEPHDVFIVNADGSGLTNLTRGRLPDGQANDWHPNGKQVLVSSGKYPGINIFSINIDGSGLKQLTFEQNMVCYYASYSPDGSMIAFAGFSEPARDLFVMKSDGSGRRRVYTGADAPVWLPDGKKIAFQVKRGDEYSLLWANADGSSPEPLSGAETSGQAVSWAPDGQAVLFQRKNEGGSYEIWRRSLLTGAEQKLLPLAEGPAEAVCRHIEALASDGFQGRKPGTPGEEKAIRYIEAQFREIGLEPGNGDSYLQPVELAEFSTIPPEHIRLQGAGEAVEWVWKEDFLLGSRQLTEHVSTGDRPFVYAGFGIHAPELGWSDYEGVDVRGKIVVLLGGTPDEYSFDTTRWKGDPAANVYGQSFYKRNEAASRGAAGVFIIYRQPGHSFWTWASLGNTYGKGDIFLKEQPGRPRLDFAGLITREAAAQLFALAGLAGFDYQKAALKPGFRAMELAAGASFSFTNSWKGLSSHNVVGLLRGAGSADEAILYTAHWDHIGMGAPAGTDTDIIFNGAVDNASGTAALIEIARAYRSLAEPPGRSILFIATTAEEMGLLGAVWYASHPLFPLGKTVAAFNMDSHHPYGKTRYVAGVVYGRSELDGYLEEAARQQQRILVPNTEQNIAQNIFFRSDHFPLAEAGVPSEIAVGAIGQDSAAWMDKLMAYMERYHQVTDEYDDSFDCSGIWQDAELIFTAGHLLSQNDHFPAWKANQPFERVRRENRFESSLFKDATTANLPVMSLQGRSMDAKPADLDGDGDLDIVVANEHAFNILLINDGDGRFTDESAARLPLNRRDSEDIAIADFDGDGDPDIIFVSEDDQANEYYENDGKGFFRDVSYKIPVSGTSNAVAVTDLNGDGFPDLLIGNAPDRQGRGGQNFCLINDGKGNWTDETAQRLPVSNKATQSLRLYDVDGDGDADLLVCNEDDNELLINDGRGFFHDETAARLPVEAGKWETRDADFGDVNGDGYPDLFLANVNFRQGKDSQNRLFINDGKGYF
ncbi:MAG: VCBS repeat-containing protein, partial [Phaeodactylibacter sp.]|nr:VCBS repeat-containing protein [Phaeodactylibacter sp.]